MILEQQAKGTSTEIQVFSIYCYFDSKSYFRVSKVELKEMRYWLNGLTMAKKTERAQMRKEYGEPSLSTNMYVTGLS